MKRGNCMNEINIYARYNYRMLIKNANLFFCNRYNCYNPKKVFAPFDGTYSISIYKYNIHISYWNEHTEKGRIEKETIKKFLKENVINMNIFIEYDKFCDIISLLEDNNNLLQGRKHNEYTRTSRKNLIGK